MGPYGGAAQNRELKIIRAVDSVLNQTLQDYELIVVADGCEKTYEIITTHYPEHPKINVYLIKKQDYWSGVPRTFGGMMAKGEFILYLDIDDRWGVNHLSIINNQLNGYDWVWYNDFRFDYRLRRFKENPCNINRIGQNGTSNICFKRSLNVNWDFTGYAHDFYFNRSLKEKSKNYVKIKTPEYFVCHLPPHPGGRAYDI